MSRSCLKCGTEFKETRFTRFSEFVIDPIPECWVGGKQNGICIKCCRCNHK